MAVGFARPDVSNLIFHLFERSIHPELFNSHATAQICQDDYQADIRICDAGHVVSFRVRDRTICEVTAPRKHPLPRRKHPLEKRLQGSRDESIEFACGIRYQVSFQLEKLDPEVFLNFHEELTIDCARTELAYEFPASNRIAPGPLSLIKTEVWPHSLLVHAYHTFPENCAVVKTQSLFEF